VSCGDQQIGALIAEGVLDALIFFVDPLSPMPHDVDVKALTRLATVHDLPMACSRSTADILIDALAGGVNPTLTTTAVALGPRAYGLHTSRQRN